MDSNDLATKASRETITRLVSEVGKEQRSMSEMGNTVERLKRVRNTATGCLPWRCHWFYHISLTLNSEYKDTMKVHIREPVAE